MKAAVISDLHLGDPFNTLVRFDSDPDGRLRNLRAGSRYRALREAVRGADGRGCDYLILLGDILDFSIAEYRHAYEVGRFFFRRLKRDGLANRIIYVPGNHDFDLWHAVEYQTSVINRLMAGKEVRRFRMSVPGILDDRPDSPTRGFTLPGVARRRGPEGPEYGGLFVDSISGRRRQARTRFQFAYPNLYLVTREGRGVLLTHGHYFEAYWSLLGEWAPRIFADDLELPNGGDLREWVAVNFPLTQAACSGTGQAGPLTPLIRRIQDDARLKKLDSIQGYLDNLEREIDAATRFGWKFWKEWVADSLAAELKKACVGLIQDRGFVIPRGNRQFISDAGVQRRVKRYYRASLAEIDSLARDSGLDIPPPEVVIWGHTHVSDPWAGANPPAVEVDGPVGGRIVLYNTGGWLESEGTGGERQFDGAEVFIYDSERGFSSQTIS